MEVLIPKGVCDGATLDDVAAITYHKSDGTTDMTTFTYDAICTAFQDGGMRG